MYDHFPSGSQVYLQISRNHIVTGTLHNIGFQIPAWVAPPYPRYDSRKLVYVRMANGRGLTAILNQTIHSEHNPTVPGFRCYISVSNNLFYVANLQPYYHEVHFFSSPRVIVWLPSTNHSLYTGMLHRGDNLPPNWGL